MDNTNQNVQAYLDFLEKIKKYINTFDRLHSSHIKKESATVNGSKTDYLIYPLYNPHISRRQGKVTVTRQKPKLFLIKNIETNELTISSSDNPSETWNENHILFSFPENEPETMTLISRVVLPDEIDPIKAKITLNLSDKGPLLQNAFLPFENYKSSENNSLH